MQTLPKMWPVPQYVYLPLGRPEHGVALSLEQVGCLDLRNIDLLNVDHSWSPERT
jgi:hypothetical protein